MRVATIGILCGALIVGFFAPASADVREPDLQDTTWIEFDALKEAANKFLNLGPQEGQNGHYQAGDRQP
jgi:hypothetical protein